MQLVSHLPCYLTPGEIADLLDSVLTFRNGSISGPDINATISAAAVGIVNFNTQNTVEFYEPTFAGVTSDNVTFYVKEVGLDTNVSVAREVRQSSSNMTPFRPDHTILYWPVLFVSVEAVLLIWFRSSGRLVENTHISLNLTSCVTPITTPCPFKPIVSLSVERGRKDSRGGLYP